jgi:hypothetical protein
MPVQNSDRNQGAATISPDQISASEMVCNIRPFSGPPGKATTTPLALKSQERYKPTEMTEKSLASTSPAFAPSSIVGGGAESNIGRSNSLSFTPGMDTDALLSAMALKIRSVISVTFKRDQTLVNDAVLLPITRRVTQQASAWEQATAEGDTWAAAKERESLELSCELVADAWAENMALRVQHALRAAEEEYVLSLISTPSDPTQSFVLGTFRRLCYSALQELGRELQLERETIADYTMLSVGSFHWRAKQRCTSPGATKSAGAAGAATGNLADALGRDIFTAVARRGLPASLLSDAVTRAKALALRQVRDPGQLVPRDLPASCSSEARKEPLGIVPTRAASSENVLGSGLDTPACWNNSNDQTTASGRLDHPIVDVHSSLVRKESQSKGSKDADSPVLRLQSPVEQKDCTALKLLNHTQDNAGVQFLQTASGNQVFTNNRLTPSPIEKSEGENKSESTFTQNTLPGSKSLVITYGSVPLIPSVASILVCPSEETDQGHSDKSKIANDSVGSSFTLDTSVGEPNGNSAHAAHDNLPRYNIYNRIISDGMNGTFRSDSSSDANRTLLSDTSNKPCYLNDSKQPECLIDPDLSGTAADGLETANHFNDWPVHVRKMPGLPSVSDDSDSRHSTTSESPGGIFDSCHAASTSRNTSDAKKLDSSNHNAHTSTESDSSPDSESSDSTEPNDNIVPDSDTLEFSKEAEIESSHASNVQKSSGDLDSFHNKTTQNAETFTDSKSSTDSESSYSTVSSDDKTDPESSNSTADSVDSSSSDTSEYSTKVGSSRVSNIQESSSLSASDSSRHNAEIATDSKSSTDSESSESSDSAESVDEPDLSDTTMNEEERSTTYSDTSEASNETNTSGSYCTQDSDSSDYSSSSSASDSESTSASSRDSEISGSNNDFSRPLHAKSESNSDKTKSKSDSSADLPVENDNSTTSKSNSSVKLNSGEGGKGNSFQAKSYANSGCGLESLEKSGLGLQGSSRDLSMHGNKPFSCPSASDSISDEFSDSVPESSSETGFNL